MSAAHTAEQARERRRQLNEGGNPAVLGATPAARDWRTESVFVATPTRNDMQANYGISMMRMLVHDLASSGVVARGGGPLVTQATAMNLVSMRNTAVAGMLDETTADWLLWVDADAGFAPDLAERLMEAADPVDRPIVGALAFMVSKRSSDDMGGWNWTLAPTAYGWTADGTGKRGFVPRYDYPDNTVMKVAATGCHALLIHRSVFQKIREDQGDEWFTRFVMPGHEDLGLMGEDFSFCVRAAHFGFSAWVHTGVKTSHQQTVWIHEDDYQDGLLLSRLREVAQAEAAAGGESDG